jgi:hypothetical protein
MGRKKKRTEETEIEAVFWCWYVGYTFCSTRNYADDVDARFCEREFEDENVLITHQRAKHFKCVDCGKRMGSIPALQGHMHHVHKTTLTSYVACHFLSQSKPLAC